MVGATVEVVDVVVEVVEEVVDDVVVDGGVVVVGGAIVVVVVVRDASREVNDAVWKTGPSHRPPEGLPFPVSLMVMTSFGRVVVTDNVTRPGLPTLVSLSSRSSTEASCPSPAMTEIENVTVEGKFTAIVC